MAYIELEEHLPGVTGLLEYRTDTAMPLRELTQRLLRGASTLTEAERELIAMAVSNRNGCVYCTRSHAAAADAYYGDSQVTDAVRADMRTAPIGDKMKALLTIALQVQQSGKHVTADSIAAARQHGATDPELHDTVMIAALFCFYNRYVDGLGTFAPADPAYYAGMAQRLKEKGYYRPEQGYDALKNSSYT
ncbi:MAG: peroxidase-related enzyme [Bacteroidia bacterium]|nr:peroxidase-related enzyme [Bacteroidia bacterium]